MIFYTGSYTQKPSPAPDPSGEGIGCFRLDQVSGQLTLVEYTGQRNPSYLMISKDRKYLYAVEELTEEMKPKVFAYEIGDTGKLKMINDVPLTGDYACHLAMVRDKLLVANYMTGDTLSYHIMNDGGIGPLGQTIQHSGYGPNKARQEGPHAHMVYPYQKDYMYVVDLGIDAALAYHFNQKTGQWARASEWDLHVEAGAGARHMVMDASQMHAYILSELSGEIFVFKNLGQRFESIQEISFVPPGFKGIYGGAAIRLHPNGKYLYASNRGPDSISIFSIDQSTGLLSKVGDEPSGGKTPRDINIDPSGNWLIAANQDSDSLEVFRVDGDKGTLVSVSKTDVNTPVNICWY